MVFKLRGYFAGFSPENQVERETEYSLHDVVAVCELPEHRAFVEHGLLVDRHLHVELARHVVLC